MNILIGCESSGVVRDAFLKKGHRVVSCDLLPTDSPGPHYQGDIFNLINLGIWDMAIFHPPCTYLCSSGLHWNKRTPGRSEMTEEALQFVCALLNAPIAKIALENPIGCISTRIHFDGSKYIILPESNPKLGLKPSQVIQPWMFGHPESKATCLWLKGLPLLKATKYADFKQYRCKCGNVFPEDMGKYGCCDGPAKIMWDNQTKSGQNKLAPSADRWKERSKTYQGIGDAMADQWGSDVKELTLF